MNEPIRLGLCGLGTVGGGVVSVLRHNQKEIMARTGRPIVLEHIGARRPNPAYDIEGILVSSDLFPVATNPSVDIVVEAIGGTDTAKDLILAAIASGKPVVTANKALIALHGQEIFAAAAAKGLGIGFEAAVAGGIPILKALREGFVANRIQNLAGIINGTSNFILTQMADGQSFIAALKKAQDGGYAEADPSFDIEGIDAAHKLSILAALAFGVPLAFSSCYVEGISQIEVEDIHYAQQLGYRVKHLGISRVTDQGVELRVHPTLIPIETMISKVDGVMNAVMVKGDAVGETLFYGAGAGAAPTASAVLSDVCDLAITWGQRRTQKIFTSGLHTILLMDQVESAFYLRRKVE